MTKTLGRTEQNVHIDKIKIKENYSKRELTPNQKNALKESIEEVGLINNITLDSDLNLCAGYNRLNACKELGWIQIPCYIVDFPGVSEEERKILYELIEIDENLVRAELPQLQEAIQIVRRKEIYETLYPDSTKGAIVSKNLKQNKSADEGTPTENDNLSFSEDPADNAGLKESKTFAKDTADKSRKSERTIQRKLVIAAIASQLDKEVTDTLVALQIQNPKLKFNPKTLEAIASAPVKQQNEIIEKLTAGKSIAESTGLTKSKKKVLPSKSEPKAEMAKKTYFLTAARHFNPDSGLYACVKVEELSSGDIRLTIPAHYVTDYKGLSTICQNIGLKIKKHKEPVELYRQDEEDKE